MLDLMRKHARNWLMKIILGIIIVVFVFYFGSMSLHDRAQRVAVIDGKPIVYADFQKEYQNLLEMYRQRLGPALTEEMIRAMNLKQQAFDNLINQAVVLKKAEEMGIRVTDANVRAMILAYPAFQRNGAFDERLYQETLRMNKVSAEEFEGMQRRLLQTLRVEELIQGAVAVSDQEVYEIYRMQNEKIALTFLQISPQAAQAAVQAAVSDLEAYLKAHEGRFRVPEQVQVRYLAFRGEDYAGEAKVSEAEVAEIYQRRKAEWTKGGKTLPLEAVRERIASDIRQTQGQYTAADQAKKAHDTIYQNDNFDAYAAANKLTVRTTALFPLTDPPAELAAIPDLGRVLAGLQKGDLSRVLQGEKGYYLLQVMARKSAYVPALKEIEREVAAAYRADEAVKRAKKEAEEILDRLKKGATMEAVARERGLKMGETGLFQPGGEIPRLGHSPELTEALYLLSEKKPYPGRPFLVGGQQVIVRFKERGPVDNRGFEGQKKGIFDYLLRAKKEQVVRAWIEGVRKAMEKDGRLEITREVKDL